MLYLAEVSLPLWNSIITLLVGITTIISFFLSCIAMFRTRAKLHILQLSCKPNGKTKKLNILIVNNSASTLSLISIILRQKKRKFTTTIDSPTLIRNLDTDTSFINKYFMPNQTEELLLTVPGSFDEKSSCVMLLKTSRKTYKKRIKLFPAYKEQYDTDDDANNPNS